MVTKSIALLVCDTPIPEVVAEHGEYPGIFTELMQKSLPEGSEDWDFKLDAYDVVTKMEYPSEDEIESYDAFMYTGSAASAYANIEWIHKLISFTAHLVKDHPKIKIFAICFGHQIVSLALGGNCVKNKGKWEVGPTKLRLTDVGTELFGIGDQITIQEMHQDHVPFVPKGFHLLASTNVSLNQGMLSTIGTEYQFTPSLESRVIDPPSSFPSPFSPSSVSLTDIHILTVQGHPEFTSPIVSKIALKRAGQGIITDSLKEDVFRRVEVLGDKVHGDGESIARTFWKALGA